LESLRNSSVKSQKAQEPIQSDFEPQSSSKRGQFSEKSIKSIGENKFSPRTSQLLSRLDRQAMVTPPPPLENSASEAEIGQSQKSENRNSGEKILEILGDTNHSKKETPTLIAYRKNPSFSDPQSDNF
jgi:hypothetical protein